YPTRRSSDLPYAEKVRQMAAHLMQANPEYEHPYMREAKDIKSIGIVLVTTDKGLCGGLNTNVLRVLFNRLAQCEAEGVAVQATALGSKGAGALARVGANLVSQAVDLGDEPNLEGLIGAVNLATTRFVNTRRQEPVFIRLLPLPSGLEDPFQSEGDEADELTPANSSSYGWDYLYEPDAKAVIDDLLLRYVEAVVYQAVA